EPERAAQEGALCAAKSILPAVASEQRAVAQVASHRFDRRGQSAGIGALIAEQDAQEQTGVDLLPARMAWIAAQRRGPAALLEDLADRCVVADRDIASRLSSRRRRRRAPLGDAARH